HERIAHLGRAELLDMLLRNVVHRAPAWWGWSELSAPPPRSAVTQMIGFRYCELPSSEKVMNSARPPIFSNGTGPPRPCSSVGTRLSADSSRLSPIRNILPGGTTVLGKSSTRAL